ncbi:hypothetical protein KM043_016947 [Ampulex compressa]|nr:hypothetical protein KM043_016947 [Ampulex compressa]
MVDSNKIKPDKIKPLIKAQRSAALAATVNHACPHCKENHYLYNRKKFLQLPNPGSHYYSRFCKEIGTANAEKSAVQVKSLGNFSVDAALFYQIQHPVLQKTLLGLVVGGNLVVEKGPKHTICTPLTESLDQQLQCFFRKREESGRFAVSLPTDPNIILGRSKEVALSKLYSLERRLNRQPDLKMMYHEFLQKYEDSRHMQEITVHTERDEEDSFYLPYQAIIREQSLTIKLIVVFDASANTSTDILLNDKLREVKVFELNTVTYGTARAPFLAMRCLRQLAQEADTKYSRAKRTLQENVYMDDVMTATDDLEEAITLQKHLTDLLASACFPLRKWPSNDKRVLSHLKAEHKSHSLMFINKSEVIKALVECNSEEEARLMCSKSKIVLLKPQRYREWN